MQFSADEATALIKAKAKELGFDDVGISPSKILNNDRDLLKSWLDNGFHASMGYMENHFEKRVDASKLVEGSKSVISLLKNYYPPQKQRSDAPVVAKYAYGLDYHEVLKPQLLKLLQFIQEEIDSSAVGRVFTDSAPILERAYAREAGLGWIGKNSNLIHKKLGSFCFIAEVIVSTELCYDTPIQDGCGGCTRCIDSCPTLAILPNRTINSNKCISFQTIENKGEISDMSPESFQNRIFGCDICQDVCLWNWKARPHNTPEFQPNEHILNMSTDEWKVLDAEKFSIIFKGSPLKRAKFSGVERNLKFLNFK